MILYLDTSNNQKTIVRLDNIEVVKKYKTPRSQEVLSLIEEALKKKKVKLEDIKEIKVNTGPGSFTGLRVGVTVANTLGWVLGVRVNDKERVFPKYS